MRSDYNKIADDSTEFFSTLFNQDTGIQAFISRDVGSIKFEFATRTISKMI